jgi:predicted flap endonuclease-1-like 5' DNA nuclease
MARSGDLKKILGVGADELKVLAGAGIRSVDQLAAAPPTTLRRLQSAGLSGSDLAVLQAKATFAAAGAWGMLQDFKDDLRTGGTLDDLAAIDGLGPRAAAALYNAGVKTFVDLAKLNEAQIRAALKVFGVRAPRDIHRWPRLAARHAAKNSSITTVHHGSSNQGTGGVKMAEPIVFQELNERDETVRDRLKLRKSILEKRKLQDGTLEAPYQEELDAITKKLGEQVVDLFYESLQELFKRSGHTIGDHVDGVMPSQSLRGSRDLTDVEKTFIAVYGILLRDNLTNHARTDFARSFSIARGEYDGNKALYNRVLEILADEGDSPATRTGRSVRAVQLANVTQQLVNASVRAEDIHLPLKVRRALSSTDADDNALPSGINIELPDLEEQSNLDIVSDNLHAMQAIYFSAMLEEVKLFQVVDKLVELFQFGMLPLSKGPAGDRLYRYMKRNVTRLSEYDRRNLYGRTLGHAGGEAMGNPNRDFQTLWLRFVSAVSSFSRQMSLDSLLRSRIPARVHQEQVRKAGRDLAANLSLYGYGMAYSAATELQSQIKEVIAILSEPEVLGAYGARDMWGVVDQVAVLELGGARDSVRYRTMASSGAIVIRWLANRASHLSSVNNVEVLDINEITNPIARRSGSPTIDPKDSDLVNACERWLAVTGTPEAQIESYSEPSEAPATTSRPISIPSVARDALEAAGIGTNGY